jgi:hypothetical protein
VILDVFISLSFLQKAVICGETMNILNTAAKDGKKDAYIREANRYTAISIPVDYSISPEQATTEAKIRIYQNEVYGNLFFFERGNMQQVRFQVVKFETWGVTPKLVRERFAQAQLRPATLREALAYVAKAPSRVASGQIQCYVALGSNSRHHDLLAYRDLSWWQRRPAFVGGAVMPITAYPMVEDYGDYWLLRTGRGECGWKPHVLFLGVHLPAKEDHLVPLPITREEYDSLPCQDEIALTDQSILGFMFRYHEGVVGRVVSGNDLPQLQCASLCPPVTGIALHRPIFAAKF